MRKQQPYIENVVNPRLTRGGGLLQPPPLRFFSRRIKTQKQTTPGIWVISFTSFAVILMKKIGGTTLGGVRVVVQSWGVGGVVATKLIF